MNRHLGTKTAVIIVTLLIFVWGMFLGNNPSAGFDDLKKGDFKAALLQNIHLGLDLRGGTHLILQVNVNEAVAAEADRAIERLKGLMGEKKLTFTDISRAIDRSDQLMIKGVSTASFGDLGKIVHENF